MMHWANKYVGVPYRRGAFGPDAFYCFGLVQAALLERRGIDLRKLVPDVLLDYSSALTAARSIRAAMKRKDVFPPVESARPDVVAVMGHRPGHGVHVGYVVEADGQLGVLHADERAGSVVWVPLRWLGWPSVEYHEVVA